ncbi:MAG: patatin-like phospholipase family protein [Bauldia sp.]
MSEASRVIGLALGGGGALGFAHIAVLEAFDELGLRPSLIAGCSMGAIVGASYAAGHSARELGAYLRSLADRRGDLLQRLWRSRPRAIRTLFSPMRATTGQLDGEAVLDAFADHIPATFAELKIPLVVVGTDFYGWRETVFREGSLRTAVAASISLPLLFRPVIANGRPTIDGGVVNPLPFEHAALPGGVLVAADVIGGPVGSPGRIPRRIETMIGATQLMMRAITAEKLKGPIRPDILLELPVARFRPLDFSKAGAILDAAAAAKDDIKRRLTVALGRRTPVEP